MDFFSFYSVVIEYRYSICSKHTEQRKTPFGKKWFAVLQIMGFYSRNCVSWDRPNLRLQGRLCGHMDISELWQQDLHHGLVVGGLPVLHISQEIGYRLELDVVYSHLLCQVRVDEICSSLSRACDQLPEKLLSSRRWHSSFQFSTPKAKFFICITELPLLFMILNRFDIFAYTLVSDIEENTLQYLLNSHLAQKWKNNSNTSYIKKHFIKDNIRIYWYL